MDKRIYFAGSIRGGRVDADLYQRIIAYINKTDVVLTEHIGMSDISLKAQGKTSDYEIYKQDTDWLKSTNKSRTYLQCSTEIAISILFLMKRKKKYILN